MDKVYKIDTGVTELVLVPIPADLQYYTNRFGVTGISESAGVGPAKYLPNIIVEGIDNYTTIGILENITDEQMKSLVEAKDYDEDGKPIIFKDYIDDRILITGAQSLYSCFLLHGLFISKPKEPKFTLSEKANIMVDTDTPMLQYKKDMNKYIDPKTTLILKIKQ